MAWAVAVLIGLALGIGSALATVEFGRSLFVQHVGPWTYNRAAGSSGADPYTRAIIAREALLALSSEEATYFVLDHDDNGAKLQESCIYALDGGPSRARWWSVTLYASDNYLARNGDHAFSIDATRINADADGRWQARISPVRGEATNWLSSRDARRGFLLMLRLYNLPDGYAPHSADLPSLHIVSCPDAEP
ncbi:MAG: DUF1214 domain-containing protein [Terricaulis silvestris]